MTHHVVGYGFPLNTATARGVAIDKAAAAELMQTRDVPCIEHRLFLQPRLASYMEADGNWARMRRYAEENHWDIVCKPNEGTGGGGVRRVRTARELEEAVQEGFATERALALCPFYEIETEYRTVVLDGQVLLVYGKARPHVVGDGTSTLRALAAEAGFAFSLSPEAATEVVPSGERRLLDWRHNLGRGATPHAVEGSVRDAVSALALRAARTLSLRFCTIDVAATASGLLVMEANAGVMLENYARQAPDGEATARRIYAAALDLLFPPEASGG
ncbi:MAG: RimK-like protein [Bacteroidota bacterium]